MEDKTKRVVLITGASTGLGLAIARELMAHESVHLVLTAREQSLHRFESEGISESERLWIRRLDVTERAQQVDVVFEIEKHFGAVDVLINNAAITYRTVAEYTTSEERQHQMSVNYRGPMDLATLVLTKMREQRSGQIIQISSAAGLVSMPTMGVYAASKHALEAASEALHFEVRPFEIKVSLVIAGFINSAAYKKSVVGTISRMAQHMPTDCYYPHFTHMNAMIGRFMRWAIATPETVAKTVVNLIGRKRAPLRVLATWDARLMWWFRRFVPHPVAIWLTYQLLPNIRKWRGKQTDSSLSGEFRAIAASEKKGLLRRRSRRRHKSTRRLSRKTETG